MNTVQATVSFEFNEDILTARVIGEIDHHSARYLREQIDGEVCYCHPKKLIVDFSGVSFMDSSGLGLLLGRMKTAEEIGCSFSVLNPGERILKLLSLAGADRIFDITHEKVSHRKDNDK